MRAEETVWRAQEWPSNNPAAWAYMESLAEADASAGRRISVARLIEQCRAKDFASADGERFKINNNYRATFARMLVKDHPEWRSLIEVRRASCDGLV